MEYQAKELFAKHDVPVTVGTVVEKAEDAAAAAEEQGGRVVVKAQVQAGGRGKAGGVKLAENPQDAVARAEDILGMDIKGLTVHRVLIAPAADIKDEYYFSFLVDRANRDYLCIASVEGGVEIEVVAHENPDALAKVSIDPQVGVDDAKAAEIVAATGFPAEVADQAKDVIKKLWDVFIKEDATLVEVNPLCLLGRRHPRGPRRQGHPRRERRVPARGRTPRSRTSTPPTRWRPRPRPRASTTSSSTVRSASSATAPGLVMSTLDVVAYAGEKHDGVKPANFLDIGGGASAEVMANGLDVILNDEQVKSVFVNVFGGITVVRRGRQRHRARPGDPGRRGQQAARRTPRRQQRRGGASDPERREPPAGDAGGHHGRRR